MAQHSSPRSRAKLRATYDALSEAEQRVFDAFLGARDAGGIAEDLNLSVLTVNNHGRAIFRAFDVNSRVELMSLFVMPPHRLAAAHKQPTRRKGKTMKLQIAAALAVLTLPLAIVGIARADSTTKVFTVSYPSQTSAAAKPTFAYVLGRPTDGSCDRLATKLHLDPDAIFIASNRNGESLCLLDDVSTVR